MNKLKVRLVVLTALLMVAIGYIIYLKQTLFNQTEQLLNARIEVLEYRKVAELELKRAENMLLRL